MCFTTIITGQGGQSIGTLGYNVLMQAIQDNKSNDDGYALRYDGEVLRTLSYYKLISTIMKKKKDIQDSKLIHLHLRKSTNTVSEEFVHMWDLGGYYCAHNGILNGYADRTKNDSLEFFKKAESMILKENLQGIKELIEAESGYGVFLLTNKLGTKAIVMSKTKDLNVEEYTSKENKVIAISSNKIGDKLSKHFVYKWTVAGKRNLLFAETEETIEFDHLVLPKEEYTYAHAKKDDLVALIDLQRMRIIKECGITPRTGYASYVGYEDYPKAWDGEYGGYRATKTETTRPTKGKRGRPKKVRSNPYLNNTTYAGVMSGKNESYLCE